MNDEVAWVMEVDDGDQIFDLKTESGTDEVHDIPWMAVQTGLLVTFGVLWVLGGLGEGNIEGMLFGVAMLVISYFLY